MSTSETVMKWKARVHTTRKKSGFDRRTASTQGYVLTANCYLTKCPKVHTLYTVCYLKCLVMCSVVSSLTSFLKLKGSSGSQYRSSVTRNAKRPTGRESGSFFLPRFHPFFGKTINLFLRTWCTLKGCIATLFSCTKDNREPHTQELYVTAMSAVLHQTIMAL